MNFNHLLPKAELIRKCKNGAEHYYLPTSHIEATLSHVAVRFRCKYCGDIAVSFMSVDEYETNKELIRKYGG